jgi:hypothetical protein
VSVDEASVDEASVYKMSVGKMTYFNAVLTATVFLPLITTQGPGAIFTPLYFPRNVRMSPIS